MRFEQQQTETNANSFRAWRSETTGDIRRSWPDAVAFREAIQNPAGNLHADLSQAGVALDRMGMPLAYSGRFAVVFRLTNPGGEKWALRCFTTPGEDGVGATRATRYKIIAAHTTRMDNTFVPFRYIDRGIKSGSEWYPVLSMRWASGVPLGRWVEAHSRDPEALRRLCGALSGLLVRLEEAGVAHGDWQHDNLLISDDGARVTLVDYDGMYVPEFAGQPCPELGHPNYQHPDRGTAHFGPGLDRFACLVIETALLALARDPQLWHRFADGESLLFKKADFLDPSSSPVFAAVRVTAETYQDEELLESLNRLEEASGAGAQSTLLPAIAPAPAPPRLFDNTAPTPTGTERVVPQTVTPTLPPLAEGQKWWQIPEASRRRTVRARSTLSTTTAAMPFVEKVETAETLHEEKSHLWRWRVGAVGLNVFLLAMLYHWIFQQGFPPFYFLWALNFASFGYSRWPRKRIYEELVAEISKTENLISGRQEAIREKSAGLIAPTVADHIEQQLRATPISQIVSLDVVRIGTLRTLKDNGIRNALDFKQRFGNGAPAMSPGAMAQITAIQRWVEQLEMDAANDFRKAATPQRAVSADVDRLRHELSEFERHAAELKREQDQFPDASFGAYLRRLAGMAEENNPSGGAAKP